MLLAANVVTLVLAITQHWDPATIVWTYWSQSVVIGIYNVIRIASLKQFSTTGFKINKRSVLPTAATKTYTASFFAFHYGFFHFIYALFLWQILGQPNWLQLAGGGLIFLFNHSYSYIYHLQADRASTPNIGSIMFIPYVRIVPMHLAILFLNGLLTTTFGLIGFWFLKTPADLIAHIAEHNLRQNPASD
jgi:hypothetical protein